MVRLRGENGDRLVREKPVDHINHINHIHCIEKRSSLEFLKYIKIVFLFIVHGTVYVRTKQNRAPLFSEEKI